MRALKSAPGQMVKLSNQRPLPQQEERKFLQPVIRPSPRGAPGHSTGVKRPPAQTPGAHTHGAGRWAQNSQPSPRSTKQTKPSPTRERVVRWCTRVSPPAHGPSRLICREGGRQPPSPSPAEETEPALHGSAAISLRGPALHLTAGSPASPSGGGTRPAGTRPAGSKTWPR